MALSTAELVDLAGTPANPSGELRLILRLLQQERLLAAPVVLPLLRPALALAA
jgi:hypothetical protein